MNSLERLLKRPMADSPVLAANIRGFFETVRGFYRVVSPFLELRGYVTRQRDWEVG